MHLCSSYSLQQIAIAMKQIQAEHMLHYIMFFISMKEPEHITFFFFWAFADFFVVRLVADNFPLFSTQKICSNPYTNLNVFSIGLSTVSLAFNVGKLSLVNSSWNLTHNLWLRFNEGMHAFWFSIYVCNNKLTEHHISQRHQYCWGNIQN